MEIDGGQHYEEENLKNDLERTKFFEDLGIKVKRYTNIEIKNNLNGVMEDLWEGLKK